MSYQTLAEIEGLGRIAVCKNCDDLHVALNCVTVRLTREAFIAMSDMIQTALKHPHLNTRNTSQPYLSFRALFSEA